MRGGEEKTMREISQDHIEEYQSGRLKKLLDVVKGEPDLLFEIRKDDVVMIYYRKGKILTIKYTKRREIQIIPLDEGYYRGVAQAEVIDGKQIVAKLDDTSFLRKYFKQAKALIDNKEKTEFSVQQNIALGRRSYDNRFLVVDMEWQFPQANIRPSDRVVKTRIDLIIVDTLPNEAGTNDIYLAELKVGNDATKGKSGIEDHIRSTKTITDQAGVCDCIKSDVESIIAIKSELGLIMGERKTLKFSPKPKMMMILAYRGEEEQRKLEAEADKAKAMAQEIGLHGLMIVKIDLQKTLNENNGL